MKIRLIDGNSLGYSKHHSKTGTRLSPEGTQIQAVFGVLNTLNYWLKSDKTTLNVFIWDGKADWRYELYPGYKSERVKTQEQKDAREHYRIALEILKKGLMLLPVLQVRHPFAEADDLAYGLSLQLSNAGHLVELRTKDEDWLQMINARCSWNNDRKIVTLDTFKKETDYSSVELVAPLKALTGDVSDSLPGLQDVGIKRAASLLSKYGSIENIFKATEDFLNFSSEPKYFHSLMNENTKNQILVNQKIVDLSKGPCLYRQSVELIEGELDLLYLYAYFQELGFNELINNFWGWESLKQIEIPKADLLSFRKGLESLNLSWNIQS